MQTQKVLSQLVRIPGFQALWQRSRIGSIHTRMAYDITPQPWYAYGIYNGAMLAKRLGLPAISVIELGVAGGRGLVAMERLAEEIEREVGVRIDVYGFDSGQGMPPPRDYRDLPHVWGQGFYHMDEAALRARLSRAELMLGDVGETVPRLLGKADLAPIAFIAFDLDYYSSTKAAFALLEGAAATRLPRIYCYFDDIAGPEFACMNEYVGELAAIHEFNAEHAKRKISPLVNLRLERPKAASWNDQIFVAHDFDHPLYTVNIAPEGAWREIPLK
ncbi:MAG TPA: hypothetical protein VGM88_11150 [Kofleriaceae bacterium]|jgi:hypothetical protein